MIEVGKEIPPEHLAMIQGIAESLKACDHTGFYNVKVSNLCIVRFCENCGATWHLARSRTGGPFPHAFTKINEPH